MRTNCIVKRRSLLPTADSVIELDHYQNTGQHQATRTGHSGNCEILNYRKDSYKPEHHAISPKGERSGHK